jgi:hypothetical protein
MPNQPSAAGIPDLRMFSSLNLRAVDDVTAAAANRDEAGDAIRRALGVDVVATFGEPCPGTAVARSVSDSAFICRDEAALRPPYWVPDDAVSAILPAADLIAPREATFDASKAVATAVPLAIAWRDDGGLRGTVTAPGDGWVWIDRAWWPGWMTTVDGQSVETLEALGGQLVRVGAGTHVVEQSLVPLDAMAGLVIGLLVLAAACAWARRGREAFPPRQPLGSTTIVTSGVIPE